MTDSNRILIIDFGSQYTQLIARRIREMGVFCEIWPYFSTNEKIREFAPKGIILSGGPESVIESQHIKAPSIVFELNCPVLGICYGMQTMAAQLGGNVSQGQKREYGSAKVKVICPAKLLANNEDDSSLLDVWMSHGDHVDILPPQFSLLASSNTCEIVAMADKIRHFYGLQFHPEVSHTKQGTRILERFVLEICQCQPTWTSKNIIQESIQDIQQMVGKDEVILGLSGGVDSSVVAALLHRAIGDQLICVFIDTGLLRLNEAKEVQTLFEQHLKIRLITIEAEGLFLKALEGVTDPEKKRKICGKLFIDLFEQESKKHKNVKWLAQGTIYSDVIESAVNSASHTIKSHHNVGGLPEKMHLKLLEPLRELFKDEVKKIGRQLGLPFALMQRHPFPGPGLSVRILGEVKKEYADKLRLADAILIEELYKKDLYNKVSQAFVIFLPVKSVGVLGDARHYDHILALRVIETIDFMTAHYAPLPHDFLSHVASRIINEVKGVSRVVYDISNKPPATIEWE